MPTTNFQFKKAEDAPNFPKASSQDYNQNLEKIDSALSDPFFTMDVLPSAQTIVDSIDASGNVAVKWILYVEEPIVEKQSFIEVNAINNGITVSYMKYGHVYINKVDFGVEVNFDSGSLHLCIHNKETNTILVSGRRISPFLKVTF